MILLLVLHRMMKGMAKRVSIFVDPDLQHSASEEYLAASVKRKSVGPGYRRRSSSLDNENGQQKSQKSLAEKVPSERKVVISLVVLPHFVAFIEI